ncbi:MAG: sulfatase [Proteobacteria bacterium]|nr:sulfatase [Pseudomonadota bacterium]
MALDETTLAEAFREHGYRTALFGKWHLGDAEYGPTSQGFDIQVPQWNGCCPKGGYHPPYSMEGLAIPGRDDEYVTDRLTKLAVDFISEASDQPWFLYMSHFSVHDPIQGRADRVDKYREKLAVKPARSGSPFILEGNPDEPAPLPREELDALIDTPAYSGHYGLPNRAVKIKQHQDNIEFAAMVESIDESVGRILEAIEANGDTENTIIVFYSDNGGMAGANAGRASPTSMNIEALVGKGSKAGKTGWKGGQLDNLDIAYATSNLPLRGAKGWLYEGGIRVPLIVHWPEKGARGLISDVPVTSADFYPTLLEMAGLPLQPAQHVDGVSFARVVEGDVKGKQDGLATRSIFWHFPHYSNHGGQSPGGAIRSGPYKLLEYFENGSIQLFNLDEDIGEQVNLVDREPETARGLLAELHAWRKRVDATMPGRRIPQ